MQSSRFVFLDRDGTLVKEVGYGHRLEDYALIDGAVEALRLLRTAGFRLAIVTNQSGIGRGIFTHDDFAAFHGRLLDDLRAADVAIEATLMCPHLPDDGCDCRKPNPSPLFRARERFNADLAGSWVIGDHAKDVQLAANAGCRGILVLTGHGEEESRRLGDAPVDAIVPDVLAAARHILRRDG
jgi:D-glycero-D-manno-heptose 1,7-bisphosphate phosphatase